MARNDVGLILIGPDPENLLDRLEGPNIFKLGPLYGKILNAVLKHSDIFCLPGHVGLGIIDALYYGLPFVTEQVRHAPEIMYLKDGVNGFMVRKGDIGALKEKLLMLIDNKELRNKMSVNAKKEMEENGNISAMFEGFSNAVNYALKNN